MSNNGHIVLKVDHNSTYIEGKLQSKVYQGFKKALGFKLENAHWMIRKDDAKQPKWKKKWDGLVSDVCYNKNYCRCHIKKDGVHFSSGLLNKATNFFKIAGVTYNIVDIRNKEFKPLDLSTSHDFESRNYQIPIVGDAIRKQRGLIKVATGGGKTAIAAAIIAGIGKAPFIFYVTSIDLLKQAKSELEKFILMNNVALKVGMIGDNVKDIQDVTVMTVQTAIRALDAKYTKFDDEDTEKDKTDIDDMKADIKDLIMSAKGMICDEVQHWAAATCQVIADASVSAQYRYGLSATPWRDKGDDLLIDACFGRCIADISASYLIDGGWLIQPEIFFVPMKNMRGMPKSAYANVYKQAIVENSMRNIHISNIAKTMENNGRLVLILCRHLPHGNMLNDLIPGSVFLHGSHSSKIRKAHLEKMRNRQASVTIATSIFDEGIDCKPLDTLILAGSGKSATRALQRVGRVLRKYPGKDSALVVDFEDHCKYLYAHSKERKRMYKTEPKFDIKYLEV